MKRNIYRNKKEWAEFGLITIYKQLSNYGENFKKPLALIFIFLVLFSVTFLFTGFYAGDTYIEYQVGFDCNNISKTFCDWLYAVVFSLKNIVPFPMNQNFYLHSDKTTTATQTLELFHKILNILFAASFTAALVRYLRK